MISIKQPWLGIISTILSSAIVGLFIFFWNLNAWKEKSDFRDNSQDSIMYETKQDLKEARKSLWEGLSRKKDK